MPQSHHGFQVRDVDLQPDETAVDPACRSPGRQAAGQVFVICPIKCILDGLQAVALSLFQGVLHNIMVAGPLKQLYCSLDTVGGCHLHVEFAVAFGQW